MIPNSHLIQEMVHRKIETQDSRSNTVHISTLDDGVLLSLRVITLPHAR